MTGVAIFCSDCSHDAVVSKVASAMRCEQCGSPNLGLDGVDPRPKTAGAAAPGVGTGWNQPMPDPLRGWSEYRGPTPQTYPRIPPVADAAICPVCHGSGYDLVDKAKCRNCGGLGRVTPPTGRPDVESYDPGRTSPAGGAGWHGASLGLSAEARARVAGRPSLKDPYGPEYQNLHGDPGYRARSTPAGEFDAHDKESFFPRSPNVSRNVKTRENRDYDNPTGPYQLDQAACPNCGHSPTQLVKDKNEDAWWHCPGPNCGPLANIDAHPEINPYSPPQGFAPDRNMKTGGFLSRNRKTGRLLAILASVHRANELGEREAVELARKTLLSFGEGR